MLEKNTSTALAPLMKQIAPMVHAGDLEAAAAEVARFTGSNAVVDGPVAALAILNSLLMWLLDQEMFEEAAALLWGPTLFSPEPNSVQLLWNLYKSSAAGLVMGAASTGKSYSLGVVLLLDWLRDPDYTSIKVIGPSEQHLEDNLFSHLVALHRGATLPLPGEIKKLYIGMDTKRRTGSITGLVVPVGKAGAGRLQGVKRVPRKELHPRFGRLSRLRVLIDEAENVPAGIWGDVDNIFSQVEGTESFKIFCAANPTDQQGEYGQRCEPEGGWEAVDIETSETWRSKRGWDVVRLDGYKVENVIEDKIIYPGLQSKEGLDQIVLNAGGTNTPGYFRMARGWFPQVGVVVTAIPSQLLDSARAEFIFQGDVVNVGAVDVALEGADFAVFCSGRLGRAVGIRQSDGSVEFFKQGGEAVSRFAIQADQLFRLSKGDTVALSLDIKSTAETLSIKPANMLIDRTNNGAGVHDYLKSIWSPLVCGLNASAAASDMKVLSEDNEPASGRFDGVVTELYFAVRFLLEFFHLKLSPLINPEPLNRELTTRRYFLKPDGRQRIEQKKDWKRRNGNKSPDSGDAFCLFVHHARTLADTTPGMRAEGVKPDKTPPPRQARISTTNRFDYLDD